MKDSYDFNRYLQQTLDKTREMALDQMQKQWEKIRNYDYRIKKLNQLVNIGFVLTFIIAAPLCAYKEIRSIMKDNQIYLERQNQTSRDLDKAVSKGSLQNIIQ